MRGSGQIGSADVREVEHLWIPMPDGCRLAARLWLPADAGRRPVPAIVEYIPYRKRDRTRHRDEPMHRYFAERGYAALRVDLRGSGESDGLLEDEYLPLEQEDGLATLAWIAEQPWCDGSVGMMGKSWGGFNALQVAARRPPALKAVISVCSTDDRYADDAHYMGGCLLNENLVWGSVLMTLNALPPDPVLVGTGWREAWLRRLRGSRLFPAVWLAHPRRDAYWKQGSVCEDYGAIACPVLAVGGWADGYTNAVPRMLAGLDVPRAGLVGPWAHLYPHDGVPGPAVGFLQEAVRWWDRWLRGVRNGVDDEPIYRAWMEEPVVPSAFHATRPGRWVAETAWPSPRIVRRVLRLSGDGRLGDGRQGSPRALRTPLLCGLGAGSWCGFGVEGEHPTDQREDDGRSMAFDTPPLPERLEVLGAPVLELEVAVDRPCAHLVARLNDVAPDGGSLRTSFGLLNLSHREGHERLEPMEPGRRTRVVLQLNDLGHAFPEGHRIRLALSTSYWPMVWPAPEPVTLTLFPEGSRLLLPVRPLRPEDAALRPLPDPETASPADIDELDPGLVRRRVRRDLVSGETVYEVHANADEQGEPALAHIRPIDLRIGHAVRQRFRIVEGDPLSARAEIAHEAATERDGWSVRVGVEVAMRADRERFRVTGRLRASENGEIAFERAWDESVPRDHV